MNYLVFGASGMLGVTLCDYLEAIGHNVIRHSLVSKSDVNIDVRYPFDTDSVINDVDAVVNLVAATNVDRCEVDPVWADSLNVQSVKNISEYVTRNGINRYVHISTDHVYDGLSPNTEIKPHPVNVYAKTKLVGEDFALGAGGVVLRTNFWGKSRHSTRKSFSDWIFDSLVCGAKLSVYQDVYFSALSMHSLSKYIDLVCTGPIPGLYNLGIVERLSKADFAEVFARAVCLDETLLVRTNISDMCNSGIKRPLDMSLDSSFFAKTFRLPLPLLGSEIANTICDYTGI